MFEESKDPSKLGFHIKAFRLKDLKRQGEKKRKRRRSEVLPKRNL